MNNSGHYSMQLNETRFVCDVFSFCNIFNCHFNVSYSYGDEYAHTVLRLPISTILTEIPLFSGQDVAAARNLRSCRKCTGIM